MRGLPRLSRLRAIARALPAGVLALLSPLLARADPSPVRPSVGYNYGQTETPRIAGTGGALRAMSNGTSALFTNPANMAATRVYHIGVLGQVWPQARKQAYGGAIVDSIVSSARLAGGFGGTWGRQDPDGVDRTNVDLRFGLAYPFAKKFFVGVAGRYLSSKQEGFPRGLYNLRPSAAAGGLSGDPIVKTITLDAGVTVKPIEQLALSLVGYNLTDPGNSLLPLTFGGGAGFGTEMFTIEVDALGDFTTWEKTTARVMGGGEVLIAGHVPVRAGYRYDNGAETHTVTGGLGYLDKAFSLDVSLERIVKGDSVTAIVFGFTYHLESTGLTPGPGSGF